MKAHLRRLCNPAPLSTGTTHTKEVTASPSETGSDPLPTCTPAGAIVSLCGQPAGDPSVAAVAAGSAARQRRRNTARQRGTLCKPPLRRPQHGPGARTKPGLCSAAAGACHEVAGELWRGVDIQLWEPTGILARLRQGGPAVPVRLRSMSWRYAAARRGQQRASMTQCGFQHHLELPSADEAAVACTCGKPWRSLDWVMRRGGPSDRHA